jgi:hypothetical protein
MGLNQPVHLGGRTLKMLLFLNDLNKFRRFARGADIEGIRQARYHLRD